jgi:AraC-like DNA-binding protein
MSPTPSDKGTISIDFVHEALIGLNESAIDPAPLLHGAGIIPELLHCPQSRISAAQFAKLWHLITEALDDEFFGMDSHKMKAGSFTLLCHTILHSTTLDRALHRALRFLRIVLDDFSSELVIDGDNACIILKDKSENPKRSFAYGTYLLMLHGLACWIIGRRIPLTRADFRCATPRFKAEWEVLFSQCLHFDQPYSGITFPAHYLAMKNIQTEQSMKSFLRDAPANFLVRYKNSAGLAAKIRRNLRNTLPVNWPDFASLAQQFHTSEATLRRRLEDEGQSFRTILNEMRRDIAISLLTDTKQSVNDISHALGFSDPSAFHRAFKNWTGNPPGVYRVKTINATNP